MESSFELDQVFTNHEQRAQRLSYLFCPGLKEEISRSKQAERSKSSSLWRKAIVDPISDSQFKAEPRGKKQGELQRTQTSV